MSRKSKFDDEIEEILSDLASGNEITAKENIRELKRKLKEYEDDVTETSLTTAESDAETANERVQALQAQIDDILDVLNVEYGVPRSELTYDTYQAGLRMESLKSIARTPKADACRNEHPCALVHTI